MKIFVRAKPRAKKEFIKQIDPGHFEVAVKTLPEGGRANEAIVKALAKHFGVAASRVRLASGHFAKQKVFELVP